MMSRIFIERPRLACVISILLVIAGIISIKIIPVSQYPDIVPPQVKVSAHYPGADSETVEQLVAQNIEEAVNGVDNMLYMSSNSANDGSYDLSVTFALGTDPDMNVVNVQNKIKAVEAKLPDSVKMQGVNVKKSSSSMLLILSFYSPNKTYDELFLSNYVKMNIYDEIFRTNGIGDMSLFGLEYSMRVWLNTEKMKQLGISTGDVENAVSAQNLQIASGSIGDRPTEGNQLIALNITTKGRLTSVEEFENIVIRTNKDGTHLYLRDIANIELGATSMSTQNSYNGSPSTTLMIYQAPGSNAIKTVDDIMATLKKLEKRFPDDFKYSTVFDATQFIRVSIEEVIETLFEALVLVIISIYLFLGNWRTTLIPLLAIPVSLVGTFAFMYIAGFTANTVSLLALVLAISIVVDDAIVVVENVERVMEENGIPAREAAIKAMEEITAPVIAITLVLLSVFVPVAFVSGITGRLYREFAITISISMLISALNALTLSPAMCALLLKPQSSEDTRKGIIGKVLDFIDGTKNVYVKMVAHFINNSKAAILIVLIFGIGSYFLFKVTPSGFLPNEDQGMIFLQGFLPNGASLDQTAKFSEQVAKQLNGIKGVKSYGIVSGFSFIDSIMQPNAMLAFVPLEDFDKRKDPSMNINEIIKNINVKMQSVKGGIIVPFQLPPIIGLGTTGGFDYRLLDLYGGEIADLSDAAKILSLAANKEPELTGVFTTFNIATPVLEMILDRDKATALGINIADIFKTMQTILGGNYINDFSMFGRSWQVNLQGDYNQRKDQLSVENVHVRSNNGSMIPLETIADFKLKAASSYISRYNNYRSVTINGSPKEGYSSGQALNAMEQVSDKILPKGFSYSWTGTSAQEKEAAGSTTIIFALAILFAYLFLVSLYESWSIPMGVLLSVVVGIFGSMFCIHLNGMENGIYVQIGLITLIALASKNAILIAEFAKDLRDKGEDIKTAALDAAKIRFRPILMTAVAAIAGFMPLITATGAGALSRFDIGITLIGGLLFASSIGLFLIPMLYVIFQSTRERFHKWRKGE